METAPSHRRPTPAIAPSYAQVHAGGACTAYLAAGSGRPVVILAPSVDGIPPWPPIVHQLALACRVVAPVIPGDEGRLWRRRVAVDRWLRSFLEGLGLTGVAVVAARRYHAEAMALAAREPDLVVGVALLGEDGEPEPPIPDPADLALRTASPDPGRDPQRWVAEELALLVRCVEGGASSE
jgi:pimeloyl-ACP methyl ester carboxylesterase